MRCQVAYKIGNYKLTTATCRKKAVYTVAILWELQIQIKPLNPSGYITKLNP